MPLESPQNDEGAITLGGFRIRITVLPPGLGEQSFRATYRIERGTLGTRLIEGTMAEAFKTLDELIEACLQAAHRAIDEHLK